MFKKKQNKSKNKRLRKKISLEDDGEDEGNKELLIHQLNGVKNKNNNISCANEDEDESINIKIKKSKESRRIAKKIEKYHQKGKDPSSIKTAKFLHDDEYHNSENNSDDSSTLKHSMEDEMKSRKFLIENGLISGNDVNFQENNILMPLDKIYEARKKRELARESLKFKPEFIPSNQRNNKFSDDNSHGDFQKKINSDENDEIEFERERSKNSIDNSSDDNSNDDDDEKMEKFDKDDNNDDEIVDLDENVSNFNSKYLIRLNATDDEWKRNKEKSNKIRQEQINNFMENHQNDQYNEIDDDWEKEQILKGFQGGKYWKSEEDCDIRIKMIDQLNRNKCDRYRLNSIKKKLMENKRIIENKKLEIEKNQDHYRKLLYGTDEKLVEYQKKLEDELDENGITISSKYQHFQQIQKYLINFIDCFNQWLPVIKRLHHKIIEQIHGPITEMRKVKRLNIFLNLDNHLDLRKKLEKCNYDNYQTNLEYLENFPKNKQLNKIKLMKNEYRKKCEDILKEIDDEYQTTEMVLFRYVDEWRNQLPIFYQKAYVALCLPKLLNGPIYFELINWNFFDDDRKLSELNWYSNLMNFIQLKYEYESDIIGLIIESIILPILNEQIKFCFDIFNESHRNKLKELIDVYLDNESFSRTINCKSENMKILKKSLRNYWIELKRDYHQLPKELFEEFEKFSSF
ncbi:hypothetical protein SNEBB_001461 [Seison nebaliae]|nr:hypothetical protein SNEBB_001461 [Seison nebaliae]